MGWTLIGILLSISFPHHKFRSPFHTVSKMTSALSLAPSSPSQEYQTPRANHVLERSYSSVRSTGSFETVQRHRPQSFSGSSLSSLTSLWAPPFRRHDENTPSRSSSSHNITLLRTRTSGERRSGSGSYSRRASLVSSISLRLRSDPVTEPDQTEQRLVDVAESDSELPETTEDEQIPVEKRAVEHVFRTKSSPSAAKSSPLKRSQLDVSASSSPLPTVRRWISTLRWRKRQAPPSTTPRTQRWVLDDFGSRPTSPVKPRRSNHKQTNSFSSSLGFVTAVRSATATLASVSIATVSRKNNKWRRGHQRSSLISGSDPRPSIDSQRSILDEAAKQRSRKRRAKLEELLKTEESYVADVKSLSNVRFFSTFAMPKRLLIIEAGLLHHTWTPEFFGQLRKIIRTEEHCRITLPSQRFVRPSPPICAFRGLRSM